MKPEIRNKRNRLLNESKLLRTKMQNAKNVYHFLEIRELQTKVYNKWKFYDNIIKAFDVVGGNVYE